MRLQRGMDLCTLVLVALSSVVRAQSNYQYDSNGRLSADRSEGIVSIEWNNMSKVTRIVRADTSHAPDLEFAYSSTGDRIMKLVKPRTGTGLAPEQNWKYIYYVYGAGGSVISTYERSYEPNQSDFFKERYIAKERHIGLKRNLGYYSKDQKLVDHFFSATINSSGQFTDIQEAGNLTPPLMEDMISFSRGNKLLEIANHIDNVLVVVSDRKILNGQKNYQPELLSAIDYYAFGMEMPSRIYRNDVYRYGFSGKERDNEIRGDGNSYDFNGRSIYDPRIGRFVSVDPEFRKGPDHSPYAFAFNNPLIFIDKTGEWPWDYRFKDLMTKDTNAEIAFVYGFLDGALDLGVEATKQIVKNNPAFMVFFAGEKYDQAKMIYKLATDPKLRAALVKQIKESAGDYFDKVGGFGSSAEVGYARGKFVFELALTVGPIALKGASMAAKGLRIAEVGAEAGAIVAKVGCFVGDTEIRVAGDGFIYIRDIRTEKDLYLLSEEELRKKGIRKEEQKLIKISIGHWEVLVAVDQLFLVEGKWKKAEELKRGDKISTVNGGTLKIKKVLHLKNVTVEKIDDEKISKAVNRRWWRKKELKRETKYNNN